MFTYSNGIDMFNAVITKGVLEQLVNTFNAAADGICRKILNIKYMITMKISFFQRRIDYCCYAFFIQYFSADTICSCIESVDELFQDTMGYDSMEHVNIIAVCVYMTIVYSTLKKKRFSLFQLQIPYADALKLLTSYSSTPWVMNAWNIMSVLLLCVLICLLPILL